MVEKRVDSMVVAAAAATIFQLEPWGTFALRRRLVSDFGESPTDPAVVGRLTPVHAEIGIKISRMTMTATLKRRMQSDVDCLAMVGLIANDDFP